MTVTYLPKGAKHTDNETVLKDVFEIFQDFDGVHIIFKNNEIFFIESGIELHVMPEAVE